MHCICNEAHICVCVCVGSLKTCLRVQRLAARCNCRTPRKETRSTNFALNNEYSNYPLPEFNVDDTKNLVTRKILDFEISRKNLSEEVAIFAQLHLTANTLFHHLLHPPPSTVNSQPPSASPCSSSQHCSCCRLHSQPVPTP